MAEELAPAYEVPEREVVAVEHPMIVNNLDKGLKTFGANRPFKRIIETTTDPEDAIPLFLRINDPTAAPIMSYNVATNNVLLKITVPKRTGRKRKRGSQDPFVDSNGLAAAVGPAGAIPTTTPSELQSHMKRDRPVELLRRLRDNVNSYAIEPVAEIRQTHRFRGLSDFHHSTANSSFMTGFRKNLLPATADAIRNYKMDLRRGPKPNEELVPPPIMSNVPMPFNWGWHQNHTVVHAIDEAGKPVLINRAASKKMDLTYLSPDIKNVPQGPASEVPDDPNLLSILEDMKEALAERPIWTRRALANRCYRNRDNIWLIKQGIQYVGYQFKGGPWRDTVIKFGVDPRLDKKYRIYQSLFYKLAEQDEGIPGRQWKWSHVNWHDGISRKRGKTSNNQTHLFDGKHLTMDGKLWQLCDLTDPLLARLVRESPLRAEVDNDIDGWYCNGAMAKIKAIMRAKLLAIRTRKLVSDEDFAMTLAFPDVVPGKRSREIQVPVPNKRFTEEEIADLEAKGLLKTTDLNLRRDIKDKGRTKRIRKATGHVKKPRAEYKRGEKKLLEQLKEQRLNEEVRSSQVSVPAAIDPGITGEDTEVGENAHVAGGDEVEEEVDDSEDPDDHDDTDGDELSGSDDEEEDEDDEDGPRSFQERGDARGTEDIDSDATDEVDIRQEHPTESLRPLPRPSGPF